MNQSAAKQETARSWIQSIANRLAFIAFITAALLWAHSYWYSLSVWREAGHERGGVQIERGILTLYWYRLMDRQFSRSIVGSWDFIDEPRSSTPNLNSQVPPPNAVLGFGTDWQIFTGLKGAKDWTIILAIPLWSIVAASGAALAMPAVGYLRQRRQRRRGFCGKCGYDLTGNTSGVCPECGNGVPAGSGG